MALIKCSDCQNDVSDMAVMCPKCGNKLIGNVNKSVNVKKKKKLDTKYIVLIVVGSVLVFVIFLIILFSIIFGSYRVDDTFEYYDYESGRYGHTIRYTLNLDDDGTCTYRMYSYFPYFGSDYDNTYYCDYKINKSSETITVTFDDGSSDKTGTVNFIDGEIYSIVFDDDLDKVYYDKY